MLDDHRIKLRSRKACRLTTRPNVSVEKFRVLFVGSCPPLPTTNGQRMRNRSLLRALKCEGVSVWLLAFADPSELEHPGGELHNLCDHVQLLPMPKSPGRIKELVWRLLDVFTATPYGPRRFRSEPMTAAVRNALEVHKFRAILCDDIYISANLPSDLSVPLLLNKHDLTHEIMLRYVKTERNIAKKAYAFLEYAKIRRMELNECEKAAAVLGCSERDKTLIESDCPRATVFLVPNVVDIDDYRCGSPSDETDGLILFVGSLDWLPNRDAVDYFIKEIFPRVVDVYPSAHFIVAGRRPPTEFRERITRIAGVGLHADVCDVRTLIMRAAVCVVPLRIGSGTRIKILEAGAMGKAVVSTHLGAEGLSFEEDEELLLEDQPEEFARAVSCLLSDPERRHRMGQAARKRVEKEYSISALSTALQKVIDLVGDSCTLQNMTEFIRGEGSSCRLKDTSQSRK